MKFPHLFAEIRGQKMTTLLTGNVKKHLLRLTLPGIAGMFAIMVFNLSRVFVFIIPLSFLGSRLFGYTGLLSGLALACPESVDWTHFCTHTLLLPFNFQPLTFNIQL